MSKTEYKKWSDEEILLLYNFIKKECMSIKMVAEILNRSYISVKKACNRYNISNRHNLTNSRIYKIWKSMNQRCYNKNNNSYKDYGERGITVCEEWKYDPVAFYDWAMENGYEENLTIDRINNNGNYCPDNCRWTTKKIQASNRRSNILISAWGEIKILSEWANDPRVNIPYYILLNKYHKTKATNEELFNL